MNFRKWLILVFIVAFSGCARFTNGNPTATQSSTPTLNQPYVAVTSVPDVKAAARAYLEAWKKDDYAVMYGLLTSISKGAMTEEDFSKHYRSVATEAALSSLDYEILSSLVLNPESAQVSYRVTLHSSLVGDLARNTVMNLRLEKNQWRVEWDDTLVIPELAGGNYLAMERYVPSRGNIYDRQGHALVAQTEVTAIGLVPGQIIPDQVEALFTELVRLTGLRSEDIQARYSTFPPGSDWYLPLGEVPSNEVASRYDILSGLSGLRLNLYKARYYTDGGIAPHIVGYVSTIQADEEEEYLRKGYRRDERIGQSGLEKWGEDQLSGKRGGALYVFNSQGQPVTRLGEVQPQPAMSIYTTISKDFQQGAQHALAGFRGAIVVLERDTGRILAMVSNPKFDPNAFEPSNYNSYTMLADIFNDPDKPYLNRATHGLYPLGSVFKLVTISAALESGRYTPESTYNCGYFFEELPGLTLNDWTYDHFLRDGETGPSGPLTLPEGLIKSCNPYFWHIGLDLYRAGLTTAVSDMARGFGLGSPTGIEVVEEETGQVPDPASEVDATNLAIGQGALLVTPLQVAAFTAALGNGGTIYQPQVVEKIAPPDAEPVYTFTSKVKGELPVSQENLKVIQDAMHGVVASTKPFGTAWHRFTGIDILVAGKTGTATSGYGEPHSWFAGYTFENKPNIPDIAVVVVVENIGEGSDFAAPIFRRIVELYFYGLPGKLYPWESSYYITQTPTPEGYETPTPEPTLPLPPAP